MRANPLHCELNVARLSTTSACRAVLVVARLAASIAAQDHRVAEDERVRFAESAKHLLGTLVVSRCRPLQRKGMTATDPLRQPDTDDKVFKDSY